MSRDFDSNEDFLRQINQARSRSRSVDPKGKFFEKAEQVSTDFEGSGWTEILSDVYGVNAVDTQGLLDAIMPSEFVKLRKAGELYEAEYTIAQDAGSYFAACVMAAAALESIFLMLAFVHKDEDKIDSAIKSRQYKDGRPDVFTLSFDELIKIAVDEDWISDDLLLAEWRTFVSQHRTLFVRLSGHQNLPEKPTHLLLWFLKLVRNQIHPSRFVRSGVGATEQNLNLSFSVAATSYFELRDQLLVRLGRDSRLLGSKKPGSKNAKRAVA